MVTIPEQPPRQAIFKIAKYAAFGVCAVAIRVAMYFFFSQWWPSEESLHGLTDGRRAWNHLVANVLAFIFSNGFAYVSNALWVFEGGRHRRRVEFLYFTLLSLLSLGIGAIGGPLMIALFGISQEFSLMNFIVVSLAVNYLGRRYLVFRR